ncbi:peptide chain release factor N(5)-glutamine methyltransferase, partial [Bacillus thuringiensis]|nr:peptide chain release factor N(5)-glutamine methyltransferase [Bacillus thuringiensis]
MPKTLKEIRAKAVETAEDVRPEDVDYVLAERLNLTPSEFELKQDMT